MFCGMKPSFGSLHMGSIRISWWVGLIRLVCTQGARVEPNQQIQMVYAQYKYTVYIYNSLVGIYSNVFCMPRKGEI
jgi:hypothetical protein